MTRPAPSTGRALAVYTGLRVVLFLVAYVVLLLLGMTGFFALGAAVLASALLSLVLLRPQREALAKASVARADAKRAEREERRRRLAQEVRQDDPPAQG